CGEPAVMQMEYNLLDQSAADVFTRAHAAGVGVISRVPLVRGLLSGRIDEHATFVEGDRRRQVFAPNRLSGMLAKVRQIQDIIASSGLPLVEAAMRFCVSNPHATVTIPGIHTPEQARANAAACEPLPAAVLSKLSQLV